MAADRKESFQGEIKVASRIIDYLSSGLYPSPGACLKELINNSYDADARRVEMFVKPDADRIIIEDDGAGMNKADFVAHFNRVSESHKRDKGDTTKGGRPKIGMIGIGFIAANEICDVMELFSTKQGSTDLLHVNINFREMRKSIEERRRGPVDVAKADYDGEVLTTDRKEHYTHVYLKSVRGEARQILAGAFAQKEGAKARSLYGLAPASVLSELSRPALKTWKDFDMYSETMLQIALNVPVAYHQGWLAPNLSRRVRTFQDTAAGLDFRVFYDGSELRKPVIFHPTRGKAFISTFNFKGKRVSAEGYFYAQHGSVTPLELHGLVLRIRHAAVGEYDPSFWGFSTSEASLIQRWVSAEIWADDRLEDAMNIDRRTLRIAHPAYVELRNAIHTQLRKVLSEARDKIYDAGSTERKERRAQDAVDAVANLAEETIAPVSKSAARQVTRAWRDATDDPRKQKALLRKFSVVELYQAVVEVAKETLTAHQFAKFLKRLTERLGR